MPNLGAVALTSGASCIKCSKVGSLVLALIQNDGVHTLQPTALTVHAGLSKELSVTAVG